MPASPEILHTTEVLIGHLDTGVSIEHPALRGKIAHFLSIDRNGIAIPKEQGRASNPHGTHTAGILCGNPEAGVPGIAPQARLCVVAVSSAGKTLLQLLGGLDELLSFDIRIACMAIGIRRQTPVFAPFLRAFQAKGILPILPIGNAGEGTGFSPGCYPWALSVGAVNEHGEVAPFSGSYGSGSSRKPDLMAPGVNILSAMPKDKTLRKSGTSMACAYVAGVAARLLQARPDATASEIRHALLHTSEPLSRAQQHRCRYGIVNMEAAIAAIVPPVAPLPEPAEEQLPAFFQTRYIDPRFQAHYAHARMDQVLEAILIPQAGSWEKGKRPPVPEASRTLIEDVARQSGQFPSHTRYFRHADVAHVRAGRSFFAVLLEHPDLLACSAVDLDIFEM